MTVDFRNVDAHPDDPVASWPYEALVAAIERGSVHEWARVTRVLAADPWGDVARAVESYLTYAEESPVAALFARALTRTRADMEAGERDAVAAHVRDLIRASGMTARQFASRAGTSPSRLSTYATGRVMPSATMMLRLERLTRRAD